MNHWAITLRRCAWVASAFCLIVFIALGWNAFASRAVDPNPPTRVDNLVTRINLDPNNKQLLADLRRQDEYLRSSYFRSIRFAQTGFCLLIAGLVAVLIFSKGADKLRAKPVLPDPDAPERSVNDALSSHRMVVALGIGLGGVLALVATLSRHDAIAAYVRDAPLPQVTPTAPGAPAGLPPAGTSLAVTAPPVGSAVVGAAAPNPVASVPTALGGTALAPLPLTSSAPTPPLTKPATAPKVASKIAPLSTTGWPSFRGGSSVPKAINLPADWDVPSGKGLLWKADLTLPGWNSPIISGGKVFLSGADEKHREIWAYDLATGRNLWRFAVPVPAEAKPVKPSPDAGYAPSTMATDGQRVFAAFVDGSVACVSVDGKPIWARQFGPLENTYGFASSLLFAGGKLIVQMDQGSAPESGKSRLYGLDPTTGKTAWETKRATSASWSSPIGILLDGKPAVIVVASPGVSAYDAATGTEIWHADGLSGEIAPSAILGNGHIFIAQQGSVMMSISATDGKVAWTSSDAALPDISSPAFGAGLVFLASSDGTTSAIDSANGKIVWEKRLEKPSRSSPLVLGDLVYLMGTDGVMRVFRASKSFTQVSKHRLGEPSQATPAFDAGRMVVRGDHHLFCIGAK